MGDPRKLQLLALQLIGIDVDSAEEATTETDDDHYEIHGDEGSDPTASPSSETGACTAP